MHRSSTRVFWRNNPVPNLWLPALEQLDVPFVPSSNGSHPTLESNRGYEPDP